MNTILAYLMSLHAYRYMLQTRSFVAMCTHHVHILDSIFNYICHGCCDGMWRCNVTMEYDDGVWPWMECDDGMLPWSMTMECDDGMLPWSMTMKYDNGMWQWNVSMECDNGMWRWMWQWNVIWAYCTSLHVYTAAYFNYVRNIII